MFIQNSVSTIYKLTIIEYNIIKIAFDINEIYTKYIRVKWYIRIYTKCTRSKKLHGRAIEKSEKQLSHLNKTDIIMVEGSNHWTEFLCRQ